MTFVQCMRFTCVAFLLFHNAVRAAQPVWHSGFEQGFPGKEWLDFDGGTFTPKGKTPATGTSAWTIVHRNSGEPIFSGENAYKGWISGSSSNDHRAYPLIHTTLQTPLVNIFMVYIDSDYSRMKPAEWIHLGTWGNHDPSAQSGKWALHTLSIRNRKLEMAHTDPFTGEYIGPSPRQDFPLRKWVQMTVYIHYQGSTGFVQAWQDGVPMLRARISQLQQFPGTHLRTAHWGMYASGTLDHGTQYNDDIRICTLGKPLTDLKQEPVCPAGRN